MQYKTILAYLSSTDNAAAVVDASVGLAEKHSAHLIGLHIVPWISHHSVPRYPMPNDMLSRFQKRLQEEAEGVGRVFADLTKAMVGTSEWRLQRATNGNQVAHILNNTMCADLVIAPQEIDYPLDGVPDVATELVLRGGRPVVIIPDKGARLSAAARIAIGWKPSREASRAVFDALPILQAADRVHLISVGEGNQEPAGTLQVCEALGRHGANVEAVSTAGTGAGKELLALVDELGSDLLVMGCYGRSRISELIFGGATRHVQKHMSVPVLMSH